MPESRRLVQLNHSLVVAVPPLIRQQLRLSRGQTVWWHLPFTAEATLTATPTRAEGYPEGLTLHDELVAARAELIRLRRRVKGLEFGLYAEGYALGRMDAHAIYLEPHGRRAGVLRRRRLAYDLWATRQSSLPAPETRAARADESPPAPVHSAEGQQDRS